MEGRDKEKSQARDHPPFPRLSFKVLQTQQGGKATKTAPPNSATDRSTSHHFCAYLQQKLECAQPEEHMCKHADTAWSHAQKQTGSDPLSLLNELSGLRCEDGGGARGKRRKSLFGRLCY